MKTIKQILMERDGMTSTEAENLINDAKEDLQDRIMNPDDFGDPFETCSDWFGLEPDYLMELMD